LFTHQCTVVLTLPPSVQFYKRAQILISDIWACFEGSAFGEFEDIDEVTMFADYRYVIAALERAAFLSIAFIRVPQSLVYLGTMKYTDQLMTQLNDRTPIPPGDPIECEIRACSIWAVEVRVISYGQMEC